MQGERITEETIRRLTAHLSGDFKEKAEQALGAYFGKTWSETIAKHGSKTGGTE